MKLSLKAIHRYPIKGFSVDKLSQTLLSVGQTIIGDRLYSIENGDSGFKPDEPKHLFKTKFIMLMKNQHAASLNIEFNNTANIIHISKEGKLLAKGDLTLKQDRQTLEEFFNAYFTNDKRGTLKILTANNHSFSDVKQKCLSILNLNSVRQFEQDTGLKIDPVRFRCNLLIDGLPAFEELNWLDKSLTIGSAKLKVFKKITRCPAVDVNPTTAIRDTNLNQHLKSNYDHMFMGVYAMVEQAGDIKVEDEISCR